MSDIAGLEKGMRYLANHPEELDATYTLNGVICWYVCLGAGTHGDSLSGFQRGPGGWLRGGFGASVYVTVGDRPTRNNTSVMGCAELCVGTYWNEGSEGVSGGAYGIGTPGVFGGYSWGI
jgi:hypothetical protein